MRNILLTIRYDGTDFHGWQRQPGGLRTVQGTIEEALTKLVRSDTLISVEGTGRTDAGVHALGQCATVQLPDGGIPTERLAFALSNMLPDDIEIVSAEERPAGFHARFDAAGKTYVYRLLASDTYDMFRRKYCWQVKPGLSLSAMREAAAFLEGTHDFAAFQSAGGEEKETTVRTIFEIAVEELPEERIDIAVTGDGFLYNMVRILVGTLVETGYGKRDPADMPALLESKDRDRAGQTAPARGLYLKKVYFPGEMGYTVEEA